MVLRGSVIRLYLGLPARGAMLGAALILGAPAALAQEMEWPFLPPQAASVAPASPDAVPPPPLLTALASEAPPDAPPEAQAATSVPGRLQLGPVKMAQLLALRSLELSYGRDSVRVADMLAQAEQALYEPILFLTSRVGHTRRQRTVEELTSSFTAAGESVLNEESQNLEMGLRQRLLSGGEMSVSARQSRRSSNILKRANTDLEVNSGLVLTIKQPLWRGRGQHITETDRRVAELEAVVTQWQFRQQMQKVMAEGLSLFWQAHVANQAVELRQALTRSAEAMLADAKERLKAGRLAPRLVNEAQRLLLQRQLEAMRAEQNRDELYLRLLSSIDLPHQRLVDVDLVARSSDDEPEQPAPPEDQQALTQWAPYRIAALRQQQGQVRLAFAENQRRPAVDLVLSHAQTGLAGRSGNSVDLARSGRYPEWYLGLNVEVGVFGNDRAQAQALAQALRVQQAETEQRAIEQTFLNDLRAKREALQTLKRERQWVQKDLDVRTQFFEQEKQRVELGGAALFSQIQAEQDLLEAQLRLVEVAGRYETARLALQLAEGKLLDAHAVETPLPSEP